MSPDMQTVVGTDRARAWHLYPVSGAPPRAAPGLTADDRVVSWTEAGSLLVQRGNDVPAKLERVDVVTGARSMVREMAPSNTAGLNRVLIYSYHPATGAYAYDYQQRLSTLFVVKGAK
jgi:hypothetical protein